MDIPVSIFAPILKMKTVGSFQKLVSTYQKTQEKAHTQHQTSMPWLGFEPTIPTSEPAKTVQALDRSATVTGI
jgi:hypothetical protein